jgi:hypothetical protein
MAADSSGILDFVTRTLVLQDTTPPLLTLCGPQRIPSHEAGTHFSGMFCAPKDNPCEDAPKTRVLSASACSTKTQCTWEPVNQVCYLNSHACFGFKTLAECTGNAACEWCDRGVTAFDIVDKEMTDKVFVDGAVNVLPSRTPIRYTIDYTLTDNAGNRARPLRREVVVDDTKAPTLTLRGEDDVKVEGATPYIEEFAEASDDYEGDVSYRISLFVQRLSNLPGPESCRKKTGCDSINRVDTMAPAGTSFQLFYSVNDGANNMERPQSFKERFVSIVDTTPPEITLLGDNPMRVEGATAYIEPGATVWDTLDEDELTPYVLIGNGDVDVFQPAFTSFNVSYDSFDQAGNAATSKFREVIIADKTKPTIELFGAFFFE